MSEHITVLIYKSMDTPAYVGYLAVGIDNFMASQGGSLQEALINFQNLVRHNIKLEGRLRQFGIVPSYVMFRFDAVKEQYDNVGQTPKKFILEDVDVVLTVYFA